MADPNCGQNEETETRLVLLESLIQTKNKEIETYQTKICDYKRLKEDFMNSQHKLIALQTKFDKVTAENIRLKRQIKALNSSNSEDKQSYSKTKYLRLSDKASQTSSDDFTGTGYKTYRNSYRNETYDTNVNCYSSKPQDHQVEEINAASELVKEVTAAASEVARQQFLASMAYEETSGLYYDYKTGYYFDAERSLFYDGNSGIYYTYDYETSSYEEYSNFNPSEGSQTNAVSKRRNKNNGYKTGTKNCSYNDKKDSGVPRNNAKSRRKRAMSEEVTSGEKKDANCKERTSYSAPPSPYTGSEIQASPKSKDILNGKRSLNGSDLEDGELSDDGSCVSLSSTEYEKYNLEAISETDEDNKFHQDNSIEIDNTKRNTIAPCVRLMVVRKNLLEKASKQPNSEDAKDDSNDQSEMKEGTLFIVTVMGGSIGREGSQHLVLLDREVGCSKDHASIMFRDEKFYLVDKGSTNGTFLNDKCLAKNKPCEIGHGSMIRIGNTIMKCHVHPGKETCFECEPGVVYSSIEQHVNNKHEFMTKSKRERLRKKEQKRIKNKYGISKVTNSDDTRNSTKYKDRADVRRKEIGSDNPFEATQSASLDVALDDNNKGFKMLSKMGWKKGEGLGAENNQGMVEPIKIETRAERSGLGSNGAPLTMAGKSFNMKRQKKTEMMQQIRQRFDELQTKFESIEKSDNDEK